MLRLNPNPVFRTLSACGPPSGEMVEGRGWGGAEGRGGVCVCVCVWVGRGWRSGGGGDPLSRDPPL